MSGHVVIVGGGIAGLAALEALTRDDPSARVTLLEAGPWLGGHIRTERQDGFIIEPGPDVLLAAKPAAIDLAHGVGLSSRICGTGPAARGSYIATARGLVRMPDGMTGLVPSRIRPFVTTPLLSLPAKLRVAAEYVVPPRRHASDESIESFVVRRLGREMYERLAEPLLSGISAGDGSRLGMATMFPQLLGLERKHGGLLRGMRASKSRAPARTSGPASSPFLSFTTGLSELVDAIVLTVRHRDPAASRITMRVRAGVSRVERGRESGFAIETATGEWLAADAVIIATPAHAASALLRPLHAPLARRLSEIEYESTVTVSLAYPRAAVARPLDASGYVVPRYLGRPVLACTWASAKFESRAPADRALFRVFLGGAGRAAAMALSDAEIVAVARAELRDVMGIDAEPVLARVHRFERAMPQYHVGHQERVEAIRSFAAEVPGLFLAGAAYGGVGIPDCVRSGDDAARATLRRLTERRSLPVPVST